MSTAQKNEAGKVAGKKTSKKASKAKTARAAIKWTGSPAARYLLLIAVTILVGLGLIMAFSASSNDAVIRQVQSEFAAQSQLLYYEYLTPEERIEHELDYYEALDEALQQLALDDTAADQSSETAGFLGIFSILFSSAYAAGFRHLLFVLIGAALAFGIARFDYRQLAPHSIWMALGLLALLTFLAVAGTPIMGSARWINLGFFSFQPSEFAKPVLLLLVAYYCAWAKDSDDLGPERQESQHALPWWQRDWIRPATLVLGCMVAILLSPDVGTALIIGVGVFTAFVLTGMPWVRLSIGLGALGAVFIGRLFLADGGYQQARVTQFIARWTEGTVSFQTWQAELALGSGGILGLGPGLSRQKFRYLPEAHNDFIIAILGEELGLLGVSLVLIAFAVILIGGLHIASKSKDRLGLAIAGGATALIVFQALLNIFAVISLGPVTGKPLPFVTLGGSSTLATFMLLGLIFSVARYGQYTISGPLINAFSSFVPSTRTKRPTERATPEDDYEGDDSSDSGRPGKGSSNRSGNGNGKKRTKKNNRRRPARKPLDNNDEKRDHDEDDFEWRWDSGTHLSSSRSRR